MKILIYTHEFPPFLGGLATTSYKLAKGLSRNGATVKVLSPKYKKNLYESGHINNFDIKRIPFLRSKLIKLFPPATYIIGIIYLYNSINSFKPDLILFITEEAEAAGGLLSYFTKLEAVPRVAGSGIVTCFYSKKPSKWILKFPLQKLYKESVGIIAVSNFSKKLLLDIGVNSKKINIIKNGVSNKFIKSDINYQEITNIRKDLKINDKDKILLTIARVLPRKGQDNVIRALPDVFKEIKDVKYLIVGTGRYENRFNMLAQQLGIADKVIFVGGVPHDQIINYIDLCDIFIMMNRFWNNKVEGLPNALMEASARSKPIIAGNHGGSKEAVVNGGTGYLVDPTDIFLISKNIIDLLLNPEKAELFGKNGKNMIIDNFTDDKMINNYTRELNALINKNIGK